MGAAKQWLTSTIQAGSGSSSIHQPYSSNTNHTLRVRLNGQKNISSSGYWICADKVEITNGGSGGNLVTNPGFEADGGLQTVSGWNTWSSNGRQDADYVESNNPKSGYLPLDPL